jgi:hypothetical protein
MLSFLFVIASSGMPPFFVLPGRWRCSTMAFTWVNFVALVGVALFFVRAGLHILESASNRWRERGGTIRALDAGLRHAAGVVISGERLRITSSGRLHSHRHLCD